MSPKRIEDLERENIALKAKIETLERMLERMYVDVRDSGQSSAKADEADALLSRLTLKQHAVMLATIGGLGYAEIADLMQADQTTVKLHLKAAITHLGAQSRNFLLLKWGPVVRAIPAEKYQQQFGVPPDWWQTKPKAVMTALTAKRSTLYKPPAPAKKRRAAK